MTTIVMTGGTSGFGEITAQRLAAAPGTTVIVGARNAAQKGPDVLPLDLSRLADVRAFSAAVGQRLGGTPIDALVLNAGLSFQTGSMRTTDGYETTFAVNHLAHYLLLRLLAPRLADGARVIITSSGTHDPAEGTILPPPKHADASRLARPDRDPDADTKPSAAGGRAYTSSKLCNVLTVQALRSAPLAAAKNLTVIAYDPGPTPGTGLSRSSGLFIRLVWMLLGTSLGRLVPKFSTQEAAGGALAELALGQIKPPQGGIYAKLQRGSIHWVPPSEMAQDPKLAETLWRESARLVGFSDQPSDRAASAQRV